MSMNAATEEFLGELHNKVAKEYQELIDQADTFTKKEKALKGLADFLHKNQIICVKNEVAPISEIEHNLIKRKRRFGVIGKQEDTESTSITDFASERAKKAIGDT